MEVKDKVTLPNGQVGTIWHIHEYGYIACDDKTGKSFSIITNSPIHPIFKHKFSTMSGGNDTCEWLDEHPNVELVDICCSSLGGFYIFYKEETYESISNRLGKKVKAIFDPN